ncbi:hypothetical protein D1646_19815 [Pseudoflavonifractor sp. 60]|nr:hypothetical protein [Pseudoflavonifractor sp. 60]
MKMPLGQEHLKSDFWPMCHTDLRPQFTKKPTQKASERVKRPQKQVQEKAPLLQQASFFVDYLQN